MSGAKLESLESRRLLASAAGLQGVYFDNSNFTGKAISRVDSTVNFSWGSAPVSGIGGDTFSVRWTGIVTPKYSQKYTFYVTSDDGARLWVNHKLLIDKWTQHSAKEDKGTIDLVANTPYDIQLEYFENKGSATAKLKWSSASVSKATIPSSRLIASPQNLLSMLDHDLAFASSQLKRTMSDLGNNVTRYVDRTNTDGKWRVVTANDWTSGFLPGTFWQMFDATQSSYWSDKAKAWTLGLAGQKNQTGDLAFRLMTTFKPLYDRTLDPAYRPVLLDAAASKNSMWNETVGAFRNNWGTSKSGNPLANFPVLMDQTTDMELLLWAAKETGDTVLYDRVLRHTRNVITHMIREDGSTFHFGYFDSVSAAFINGETYQGYSNDSAWARGQAWAIHSLTTIAKETGDLDILAAAQKVSDYFLLNLPADSIPFWDFNDPKIPVTYKDSSAAAVAASGLIQLSTLISDPLFALPYRTGAERILTSLSSSAYLAETKSSSRGILLHAAQNVPNDTTGTGNDTSLIFGDYYFLQAINRYRSMANPV